LTIRKKTALITGITGQDGAFLAKLLVEREYRVVGVSRNCGPSHRTGLRYAGIDDGVELRSVDLADARCVTDLISELSPDEVYNLAADSSVANSFAEPRRVFEFNSLSVLNLLEAIRTVRPTARFYQASSSEMFAGSPVRPIVPELRLAPLSPYACSKAAGHQLTAMYRDCYGIFAVGGILFNHESILRSESYFVKKVIRSAIRIRDGAQDSMTLGNLDVRRDIGLAERYVEAMWLMLQQTDPRNYVICSGVSVRLREVVDLVLRRLQLSGDVVCSQRTNLRPTDAADIYGDPHPARAELGWQYALHPLVAIDWLLDEEIGLPKKQIIG
jgi:GDPmannose 4,6-dehydratase